MIRNVTLLPRNFAFSVVCAAILVWLTLVTVTDLSKRAKNAYDPEVTLLQSEYANLMSAQETLDLAYEFGFDPMIVRVTQHLAASVYNKHRCDCATWRFVRSADDLTYMLLSIIAIESRGNPRAINIPNGPSQGIGLTQLVLSTARMYNKSVTQDDLMTIPAHMEIAVQHFVDLLMRYNGNHWLAILAWNRGIGAVERSLVLGKDPENGYGQLVLARAAMRNAGQ